MYIHICCINCKIRLPAKVWRILSQQLPSAVGATAAFTSLSLSFMFSSWRPLPYPPLHLSSFILDLPPQSAMPVSSRMTSHFLGSKKNNNIYKPKYLPGFFSSKVFLYHFVFFTRLLIFTKLLILHSRNVKCLLAQAGKVCFCVQPVRWIKFQDVPEIMITILLMEEILHQFIRSLSHYLQGFINPRWLAEFLNHQQYE